MLYNRSHKSHKMISVEAFYEDFYKMKDSPPEAVDSLDHLLRSSSPQKPIEESKRLPFIKKKEDEA